MASAEKAIKNFATQYKGALAKGETVLWASGNLAITNSRFLEIELKFKKLLTDTPFDIRLSLPLSEIDLTSEPEVKDFALCIRLKNGGEEKTLAVFKFPLSEFRSALRDAIAVGPASENQLVTSTNRKEVNQELDSKKKLETKEAKAKEKREFEKKYGQISISQPFGTKWITIYSKGYVKVSSGMGVFKGQVERLIDIFGETDLTKKTGLGRAVGAVVTMGANIALSPNQRGNIYLTIATDRSTHSLFWERPDASSIKTMNKIVSAGKAAIARANIGSQTPAIDATAQTSSDLPTQLANLAALKEQGILSQEEFEKAKAKLLG